jgi:hypothetical protein
MHAHRFPVRGCECHTATPMAGLIQDSLCATCRHQRIVRSGRGSVFSMCLRHRTDPAFRKYPPLPVLSCPGYEPGGGDEVDDAASRASRS